MSVDSVDALATRQPIDDVQDRLNDPAVANALVLLLDNIESLAVLAMGADGLLRRGQTITDTLADGLADLKTAAATSDFDVDDARDQAQDLLALSRSVASSSGDLAALLGSGMLRPDVVALLGQTADALVEARAEATDADPEITGPISAVKVLRDPEVQKGLSFLVGVARSLGRRMDG